MCGIAGFVSTKKKPFDYTGFCTLGIANDARGGDSCGIFIDGLNQYGTGKNKLFSNFFQLNKSLKSIKQASVAFVHCRKASIGAVNEQTAQPVVIKNKKGKTVFVLMHNGTIHNYEELAKKYIPNIDIKGMTDSQVMARIFYNNGYNVLNEYNGSAVFAIVDYRNRKPRVLFWKGASKKTLVSKNKEEERPLFFCYNSDQIIFSSIAIYLMALKKSATVRTFPDNVLCEYKNGRLYIVAKYDRENRIQNKQCNNINCGYQELNYNGYLYEKYFKTNNFTHVANNKATEDKVTAIAPYINKHIDYSIIDNLYRINMKLAHGMEMCTLTGNILPEKHNIQKFCKLWFFNGRLLYNNKCFKFLELLKKKANIDEEKFNDTFKNIIGFLSSQHLFVDNNKYMKAVSPSDCIPFTGFVYSPISTTVTNVQLGSRCSTSINGYNNYEKAFSNIPDFDFKIIKKWAYGLINDILI